MKIDKPISKKGIDLIAMRFSEIIHGYTQRVIEAK